MEFNLLFSISWMLICIVISIPLFKIIYDYIQTKPIVEITIIDLAYSDCLFFLFSFCFIFTIGISACLLSETTYLGFTFALIFSWTSYFALCSSLWSLTITGLLRFISIIKNSEQAGIQILGPDNVGIWKIRWISIVLTSCLLFSGYFFFHTSPSLFYTLYNQEATLKPTIHSKVYWIPMITVTLANAVPKLYSTILKRKLFSSNPERYVLSLETSLSFPFLILLLAAFQFTTRANRLLYYDPLLVMFGSIVIPMIVILQNKKTNQPISEHISDLKMSVYTLFKKRTTNAVTPVCENNVGIELHI